jgi:uncharacterized membrane protein
MVVRKNLYSLLHHYKHGAVYESRNAMVRRKHWHQDHYSGSHDRAKSILRERYARGEIDKADFEARKRDLME